VSRGPTPSRSGGGVRQSSYSSSCLPAAAAAAAAAAALLPAACCGCSAVPRAQISGEEREVEWDFEELRVIFKILHLKFSWRNPWVQLNWGKKLEEREGRWRK